MIPRPLISFQKAEKDNDDDAEEGGTEKAEGNVSCPNLTPELRTTMVD
jgi:hypothetical protein